MFLVGRSHHTEGRKQAVWSPFMELGGHQITFQARWSTGSHLGSVRTAAIASQLTKEDEFAAVQVSCGAALLQLSMCICDISLHLSPALLGSAGYLLLSSWSCPV